MSNPTLGYTLVKNHAVLGQVMIDPSLPDNTLHIYRVVDGDVVVDKIVNIGNEKPEEP